MNSLQPISAPEGREIQAESKLRSRLLGIVGTGPKDFFPPFASFAREMIALLADSPEAAAMSPVRLKQFLRSGSEDRIFERIFADRFLEVQRRLVEADAGVRWLDDIPAIPISETEAAAILGDHALRRLKDLAQPGCFVSLDAGDEFAESNFKDDPLTSSVIIDGDGAFFRVHQAHRLAHDPEGVGLWEKHVPLPYSCVEGAKGALRRLLQAVTDEEILRLTTQTRTPESEGAADPNLSTATGHSLTPVKDEHKRLIEAYKHECRSAGVKVTDEKIARAASEKWNDRSMVMKFKRGTANKKAAGLIMKVLREKPHLKK